MVTEDRYNRQILVQGWDQEKLMKACVFIAGVGALGCEVAKNLALMGTGKLILADNDVVELSNLNRQMLFTNSDIGLPKVQAVSKRINILNPSVSIALYYCRIQEVPQRVYEKADLIIGGLDNWPSRRFLNSMAIELKRPYIDGGIYGLWGNVQVVIPFKSACLECQGSILVPEEIREAECTLRRRKPEDLHKDLIEQGIKIEFEVVKVLFDAGYKTLFDLKYSSMKDLLKISGINSSILRELYERLKPKMPAIQTVNAVVGGIQAHEALKIIMEGKIGTVANNFIQYDGATGTLTNLELGRNEECVVCSENFRLKGVDFFADRSENILNLKDRITLTFGYPDVQIQHRTRILADNSTLENVSDGDCLYVHSIRLSRPLKLIVRMR